MPTRPNKRRLLAAGVAAVLLVVVAGVVVAGSSPSACARCHGGHADGLSASDHATVGCYACHAPGFEIVAFKVTELTRMYPAAILGGEVDGPSTETDRDACLRCHSNVLRAATSSAVTGIRIVHEACAPQASCDGCHSTSAHGSAARWARGPVMEDCVACHRAERVETGCETCHAGRDVERRVTTGPWQITHGPKWKQTHGMGDLESCVTCHPGDYCVRCHKVEVPHAVTFGARHGELAEADRENCISCHRSQRFCDACHGTEMPHPDGFLERHSAAAGEIENPACQRCHAVEDCNICHRRHVHPGNARFSSGIATTPLAGGSSE